MMKHFILSLILVLLLIGCNKTEVKTPDNTSVTGIYAVAEIGSAGHWRMSKLNESMWDFELFGDTISFGDFGYGA